MFKPGKNAVSRWCGLCLAVSKPGVSLSSPLKTDLHLYKVHAPCILLHVAPLHIHWRGVCDCPRCKTQAWPKIPQVCKLSVRATKIRLRKGARYLSPVTPQQSARKTCWFLWPSLAAAVTTTASPPSRSCTNAGAKCVDLVLDEHNVKPCTHSQGRAQSTAPLVCIWPSPVGSKYPSSSS